uniref:Uncharacterized protein AlNc14C116G6544 n=1 Tax=Albugo laibachii Nc14 TaxID=890382 RepID=F0WJ09_9STRA|nr:conserved hypothetical protein [Albugo laibachii Nc14]|eukprot:CCA21255.1 conserved hypothetical protein [Albugo laibachii Nc14]
MIVALRVTAHILPLVLVFLVYKWMGSTLSSYTIQTDGTIVEHWLAGFSWKKGDNHVFNWHPMMMTTGFIFSSSQAALVYITSPYSHEINKRIHLSLHMIGFICAIVGLVAVFRFHFEHNITNLYSLHSWLGISVSSIFALHYIWSFIVFFFPGSKAYVRSEALPIHIGIGLGLLATVYLTAAVGIQEKLFFNNSCNLIGRWKGEQLHGKLATDCVLGISIGLLLLLTLVVLIVTIWHAKHPSEEHIVATVDREETHPLLGSGSTACENSGPIHLEQNDSESLDESEDDDDIPDLIDAEEAIVTKEAGSIRFEELKCRGLVDENGLLRDGYDYSKHMKIMGQGNGQFYSKHGQFAPFDALTKNLELPEDVLPGNRENERLLDAITLTTDTMDADLREALVNVDAFEELTDDFVIQASADDVDTPADESPFDYDAHIAKLLLRAGGELTSRKAEKSSKIEEEIVTKPTTETQELLDAQFEEVYAAEYQTDDESSQKSLDDDDFDGTELEGHVLEEIFQDYVAIKRDMYDEQGKLGNPCVTGNRLPEILAASCQEEPEYDEFTEEEDTDAILSDYLNSNHYVRRPRREDWDCETIVSTYSNMDNHPTLLCEEGKKNQRCRARDPSILDTRSTPSIIQLSRKTGMPLGVLDSRYQNRDSTATLQERKKVSAPQRTAGESLEEKKARKALVKRQQRERRKIKKEVKQEFSHEEQRQAVTEIKSGKVVVFSFSIMKQ